MVARVNAHLVSYQGKCTFLKEEAYKMKFKRLAFWGQCIPLHFHRASYVWSNIVCRDIDVAPPVLRRETVEDDSISSIDILLSVVLVKEIDQCCMMKLLRHAVAPSKKTGHCWPLNLVVTCCHLVRCPDQSPR